MLTDIHTHAFHPKIAVKAVEHLNEYYKVHCQGLGTIDDLQSRAKKAGIERCVVLCAATEPAQVIPANSYAIHLQDTCKGIVAFGTVHPGYDAWEQQLVRLKQAGIGGIKLHPEFQHFWLDDPRLFPIFEHACNDFIFQIHIGDYLPPAQNPSCPYKLAAIIRKFPKLRVIAAHLGGYQHWKYALEVLVGRDVWLETSSSTPFIDSGLLRQILKKHDSNRILFGSDYPLYDPLEEQNRLQSKARLTDAQLEQFMQNAEGLLLSCVGSGAHVPS